MAIAIIFLDYKGQQQQHNVEHIYWSMYKHCQYQSYWRNTELN